MPTSTKIETVSKLSEKMRSAKAIYFADYQGLTAPEATELRAQLRASEIEFTVMKKTLSRLAAKEAGLENIDDLIQGQMALAFAFHDPAAPAKILRQFSKQNRDIPVITGLVLEGQALPAASAKELADLPTKEVLLMQLLGVLQQPLVRLASTLGNTMTNMLLVLQSLGKQQS
jgi:large subunit ribosomal protein L10